MIFIIEQLSYRSGRIAHALAEPSSSVHRAPLVLLDLSVANSRGRFGLEERAYALSAMGQYGKACEDVRRLARLKPDSTQWAKRSAHCTAESALGREGLESFKVELLSDPGLWRMNSDLPILSPCEWYGWQTRGARGADYLDRCVKASPDNPILRQNRGVAYYLAGNKKAAVTEFRAAIRNDPSNAAAHLSLASALCELGLVREALAPAEKGVALAQALRVPALLDSALSTRASIVEKLGGTPKGL